ncbi:MAG: aldose 1-epimerase [Burkholderiales bacterium]|nr:aldose 1-epimerase [Burkholderiales bacterium]
MPIAQPAPLLWLQAGNTYMALAPEVGGSIAALYTADTATDLPQLDPYGAFHWLRPASVAALQARDPLGMASFPLVPWCNRIRDGRAEVNGQQLQLPSPGSMDHAIHGLGWQDAWETITHTQHSATLEYAYPGGAWPWAFTAQQSFTLAADGLHCAMSLRNDSLRTMPAALGHHPYFPHRAGTRLRCAVDAMWESDTDMLPLRRSQPAFLPALCHGMPLSELNLDNNFTGWDRQFSIDWPEQRRHLRLTADAPLDYFVLFCPQGADHFCAEPVSNCTDWLNRPQDAHVGGTSLAAGAELVSGFRLAWGPSG